MSELYTKPTEMIGTNPEMGTRLDMVAQAFQAEARAEAQVAFNAPLPITPEKIPTLSQPEQIGLIGRYTIALRDNELSQSDFDLAA